MTRVVWLLCLLLFCTFPIWAATSPPQQLAQLPPALPSLSPTPTFSPPGAVEMGLAGARLDQDVLELLDRFGQPGFVGPTGAIVGKPAGEPFNAPAQAATPGRTATTTAAPMAGGGLRLSLTGNRDTATPRTSTRGAPPGAALQAAEAPHYWLWHRGGYQLAVALTPKGIITAIMVAGKFANPSVRTEKGITLNDPYDKIISAYGFPESTENRGGLLIIRYPSSGLTFTLEKQRVIGICLEARPGPGSGMVTPATISAGPLGARGPLPAAPGRQPASSSGGSRLRLRL